MNQKLFKFCNRTLNLIILMLVNLFFIIFRKNILFFIYSRKNLSVELNFVIWYCTYNFSTRWTFGGSWWDEDGENKSKNFHFWMRKIIRSRDLQDGTICDFLNKFSSNLLSTFFTTRHKSNFRNKWIIVVDIYLS